MADVEEQTPVWDEIEGESWMAAFDKRWREARAQANRALAKHSSFLDLIGKPTSSKGLDVLIPPQLVDKRNRKITMAEAAELNGGQP